MVELVGLVERAEIKGLSDQVFDFRYVVQFGVTNIYFFQEAVAGFLKYYDRNNCFYLLTAAKIWKKQELKARSLFNHFNYFKHLN